MRRKAITLRTAFVVTLAVALAGVFWLGSAQQAAAFFRMGGHFGGARMGARVQGHAFGGRHGVRDHGSGRISNGRRADLPTRGREGHSGRGVRYFPHRRVVGNGVGHGLGRGIGPLGLGGNGGAGGGGGGGGLGGGRRVGGVPPAGESRFVPDEVLVEFQPRISPQTIARFARTFSLTQLNSQSFSLLGGATFYRWRVAAGNSVPGLVATLQIKSSSPTRSPITCSPCRTRRASPAPVLPAPVLPAPVLATMRNTRCAHCMSNRRSKSPPAKT